MAHPACRVQVFFSGIFRRFSPGILSPLLPSDIGPAWVEPQSRRMLRRPFLRPHAALDAGLADKALKSGGADHISEEDRGVAQSG